MLLRNGVRSGALDIVEHGIACTSKASRSRNPRCMRVVATAVAPSKSTQVCLSPELTAHNNNLHHPAYTTTYTQAPATFSQLPQAIRDTTVVLHVDNPSSPTGKTTVYLLGVSHISKRSAEHVKDLISTVKPQVVMLELCKDRLPLLMDPDSPPPQIWHTRRVRFNGLPEDPGYPSAEEILATLHTQPGNPITVGDIEADSTALLSSGRLDSTVPRCWNNACLVVIHVVHPNPYSTLHVHTQVFLVLCVPKSSQHSQQNPLHSCLTMAACVPCPPFPLSSLL